MKRWLRLVSSLVVALPVVSRAVDGSWGVDADGAWSVSGNWSGGVIATGTDARAFFTTAITSPRTVSNDMFSNTVGHLSLTPSGASGWTISGQILALSVGAGSPTATVASGSSAISARMVGTQGLVKAGSGALQLSANNTYTGATQVVAGNLVLTGGVLNSSVGLSPGTMLSAQMGQGLVGEYYYVAPPNINNANPNFATLPLLQTYLSALSPTLLFNGPTSGTNFDYGSVGGGTNNIFPTGSRTTDFQTRWKGTFLAPASGTYYFGLASDDGSMLWIDGAFACTNNSFQGYGAPKPGTISLTAGPHEIVVAYYEGSGGYGLTVDMALPGDVTNRLPLALLQTGPAIGSLTGAVGSVLDLSNAPIIVAQSANGSFDGTLSGGNALRKIGAATLTLTADNSAFTGGLALDGGSVSVGVDANIGSAAGAITFAGGALRVTGTTITSIDAHAVNWTTFHGTLDIADSSNVFTVASAVDGTGTLGKTGPGRLVLTNASPHLGTLLVSSGVVDVAVGASIASSLVQVNGGGQLVLESSASLSANAAVSLGFGAAGYGKVYLTNGVNQTVSALYLNTALQKPGTYGATGSGATYINDNYFSGPGLLTVTTGLSAVPTDGSWGVNQSGDWGVTNNWVNGALAFGTNATAYFTNAITGDRTVNNGYTALEIGNLYFFPTNTFSWFVTNGAMRLATTSGVAPTITVGKNNATVGSALQGSQGLTKTGIGQLILTGQGTYSGTTTVNQGTVQITGNATLYNAGTASGAIVVDSGATLSLNRSDILGVHTVSPAEPLTIASGGLVQNSGAVFNTFKDVTLNGGELRANGGASANFQAFQLKGTVTVSGVSASLISATRTLNAFNQIQLGNNTNGGVTALNVADVTGSPEADLLVSAGFADGRNAASTANVPSGFVKTGPGKVLMSGNSINTGPSALSGGELVVSGGVVNAALSLANGTTVSAEYGAGLVGEYYFTGSGTNPVGANFNTLEAFASHLANPTPTMTGVYNGPNNSTNFDFTAGGWPANLFSNQYYETRWAGKINLPSDGVYYFALSSDDGSFLWIDGTRVIAKPGSGGLVSNSVALTAGLHDFTMLFNQGTGGFNLYCDMAVPGGTTNRLPLALLQTPPAIGSLSGVAGGVVNVSNAPVTIAQMSDGSYAGAFAGTNRVRKVGHGILTLTSDNSSFPGTFELGGGRVAIAADNQLPANAVFNGGVLRIEGTGITAPPAPHAINWPTFVGGFDIADAANSFTVTNSIGFDNGLSSLWKFGPGPLTMAGSSNVLNLGLNVMTGVLTMSQNRSSVNGGLNISRGQLVLDNAFLQNVSNNVCNVGNVAGDFGTMTIGGTSQYLKTQNNLQVANANGSKGWITVKDNATLRKAGGLVYIGNSGGSAGALYQSGGSLAMSSDFNVPRNAGAYGFFQRTGGSATNTGNTQHGGGVGLIYQEAGLHAQVGSNLQIGNNVSGSGTGVLWVSGGTVTSTVDLTLGAATNTRSEFTVSGGQIFSPNLRLNNNANNSAIANLNGGLLQVNTIFKLNTGGTNILNFNGGTLQARTTGNLLGGGGTNSPDNIYIRSGGAILDSGSSAGAIVPNLIAPPGDGVAGIAVTNGGAGYLGAPYVFITGGGGTGATAVAQINLAAGTVTNIVITSPGVNYSTAPSATLVGGGSTAAAGLGTVTTAPNLSGGVTIKGSGSIALLGTNTYSGATVISNGILLVNSTNTITGTLLLATNTAGIGPTYPMDQAFLNWLTNKIGGTGSGGILALGTNSANNLDLTAFTNWTLGAAGGSHVYSGGLTVSSTNVYLGGSGGNLLYQPNLVTGTNYFIGLSGGSPVGIVTITGTNDTYSSGIIVQGGTLRAARTNCFGSSNATVTVQDGASLDVYGQNLNKVQVFVTGKGVSPNGAIVNSGSNAIPALQFVTLTGDTTFGGPARWDIRTGAIGPRLDLAGYTLTKTNGNEFAVLSTEVTDGSIIVGQGIFRFENTANATSGVGTITVGPSGNLDFWNFNGTVTRPVTVNGGNVTVGAGTANVGSSFALSGVTNTFIPANGTALFLTNQISGGGTLRKMGLGTVKIATPAMHTGATHINLGTIEIAADDPVNGALTSSSGVIVQNGATLRLDYDQCLFGANVRPLTIGNGGFLSTSNGVGYHLDKPFTLAGGIITGGVPHATLGNWIIQTNVPVTALSSITAPRSQLDVFGGVVFDVAAGGLSVSGSLEDPLGGTGTLVKTGSGTMTITGTNTYQGATIVASGTLKLAAFAPAGGASIWLDASDDSTITRDGSGFVSQWSDKSGHSRHATQPTNALKPSFITNALLNRTVVRFAGGAQLMNADLSFLANNGYSIFAVEGRTNNGNYYFLGTQGGGVNNQSLHFGYRSSNQFTLAHYGNDLNTPTGQPAPYSTQQFRLWDGIFDFVNQYIYLDTTNVATRGNTTAFLPTIGPGVVGAGYNGNNFQGDLAEILIYNRGVNPVERQQIEGYLRQKWFGVLPPELSDLLPVATPLRLASGATFDLGGVSQSLGSLSDYGAGGGTVTNSSVLAASLSIGNDNTDAEFSGPILDGAASIALNKTGSGRQTLHGNSTFSGGIFHSNGTLIVNGSLSGTGGVLMTSGTLGGTGTIAGTVVQISGTVAPGASPGKLTILGDYVQAGELALELAGMTPGGGHDQLAVGGSVSLLSSLSVTTNGGFVPAVGNVFTVLTFSASSGTFTSTSLPPLNPGLGWVVDYQSTAVILSVTGAPPPAAGYDLFAQQIPNPADRGYQADPDADGYANLLEFVTGSSPTNADQNARMNAARTNGVFALKFIRATNSMDATLFVEGGYAVSNNASWTGIAMNSNGVWSGDATVGETFRSNLVNDVTVQDTEPAATNRFLRLRVTRP